MSMLAEYLDFMGWLFSWRGALSAVALTVAAIAVWRWIK